MKYILDKAIHVCAVSTNSMAVAAVIADAVRFNAEPLAWWTMGMFAGTILFGYMRIYFYGEEP